MKKEKNITFMTSAGTLTQSGLARRIVATPSATKSLSWPGRPEHTASRRVAAFRSNPQTACWRSLNGGIAGRPFPPRL